MTGDHLLRAQLPAALALASRRLPTPGPNGSAIGRNVSWDGRSLLVDGQRLLLTGGQVDIMVRSQIVAVYYRSSYLYRIH